MSNEIPLSAVKITVSEAAGLLHLTRARLWQLAGEGVLPAAVDGEYVIVELIGRYVKHIRDDPQRQAAADLKTARQRKIELEIAQKEGKLVDWEDVQAAVDHIFATQRNGLDALPSAVTRDIALRTAIEGYLESLYGRWHKQFNEYAERLRRGEDPFGDDGGE